MPKRGDGGAAGLALTELAPWLGIAQCQAAFVAPDHTLAGRYDRIELLKATPVITRVERYAARNWQCSAITLAPPPQGLGQGSPFSINMVAPTLCLRLIRHHLNAVESLDAGLV